MLNNTSGKTDAELNLAVPKRPAISTDILDTITELVQGISTLCQLLPMQMVIMSFNMFMVIIDMFNEIKNALGVPSIPYPLNLAPDCAELCPKIVDFMLNA